MTVIFHNAAHLTATSTWPQSISCYNHSVCSLKIYVTNHFIILHFYMIVSHSSSKHILSHLHSNINNNNNNNNINNNPMAPQLIKGQGLPTNCLPHFYLFSSREEKSPSQFGGDVCQHVESPYKSAYILIPHESVFLLIPYTWPKIPPPSKGSNQNRIPNL